MSERLTGIANVPIRGVALKMRPRGGGVNATQRKNPLYRRTYAGHSSSLRTACTEQVLYLYLVSSLSIFGGFNAEIMLETALKAAVGFDVSLEDFKDYM